MSRKRTCNKDPGNGRILLSRHLGQGGPMRQDRWSFEHWRTRDEVVAAIGLVTGSGATTGWINERHDIPPICGEGERQAAIDWLREVGFLVPGEDDETWGRIRRNWLSFLSATSPKPDARLAPNRKAVRVLDDDDEEEEGSAEKKRRFQTDRR